MEKWRMKCFKVILILALLFEKISAADDFQDDVKSLTSGLMNLIELKSKFRLPYIKFGFTFKRVVICGLSRPQKLALCYHILRKKPFKYDFFSDTHPYLSCHRTILPMNRTPTVSAFKCPTPHRMLGKETHVPIHSPVSYYLSGAVYPVKAIMYYNYVGHRIGIVPHLLFSGLTNPSFEDISKIERNRSYQMIPTQNRLLYHDVTPYYIQQWKTSVIRAPQYAETQFNHLILDILKNNQPYSKFRMAFNKIQICGLGSHCSRQICGHAFEGNEYNYNRKILSNVRIKCMKLPINLVYTNSRPFLTSVLYCGDAFVDQIEVKSFFLSASFRKNSILTYARYYPHNEILPEAVISNIDLNKLRNPFQISKKHMQIITTPRKKRKLSASNVEGPTYKKEKINNP